MPGETVEVTLTAEDRQSIQNALVQLGFPKSTYVKLLLRTVTFNDDTMWRAGEILRRAPGDPETWKVVSYLALETPVHI